MSNNYTNNVIYGKHLFLFAGAVGHAVAFGLGVGW